MIYKSILSLLFLLFNFQENKTIKVEPFTEVIISPHIEVVFKKSNEESVIIENSKVASNKINIEVDDETLRIYLDEAKTITKTEKVNVNGHLENRPIYNGTMVTVTVNYKNIKNLSIRGEEIIKCVSPLNADDFEMEIYGESKVYLDNLEAKEFTLSTYGEAYLEIKSGNVEEQKYRCYGESEVNVTGLKSKDTKITAYGDNHIMLDASRNLKVTAFGDAVIQYKGDPKVKTGLKIGGTTIRKID